MINSCQVTLGSSACKSTPVLLQTEPGWQYHIPSLICYLVTITTGHQLYRSTSLLKAINEKGEYKRDFHGGLYTYCDLNFEFYKYLQISCDCNIQFDLYKNILHLYCASSSSTALKILLENILWMNMHFKTVLELGFFLVEIILFISIQNITTVNSEIEKENLPETLEEK